MCQPRDRPLIPTTETPLFASNFKPVHWKAVCCNSLWRSRSCRWGIRGGPEPKVKPVRVLGSIIWGLLGVGSLLLGSSPAYAQGEIAGTYRCASIHAGKQIGRCASPPLILHADGSYQIWNEQGTYSVLGKYVVFSEAKKRGPGRLVRGREIVFEYFHRGRKHQVVFRREDVVPLGSAII